MTRWVVWGSVAAVLAACGVGLSLEYSRAQERARRCSCMSNVRLLGLAAIQYAEDHGGNFPPSLGVLLKEGYLTTLHVFLCPSHRAPWPKDFPKDFASAPLEALDRIEELGDYVLVKGLRRQDGPVVMVACDRPGNHHGEGRNCFFSDGHVEWMTELRFQDQMAKQKKTAERQMPSAPGGARQRGELSI